MHVVALPIIIIIVIYRDCSGRFNFFFFFDISFHIIHYIPMASAIHNTVPAVAHCLVLFCFFRLQFSRKFYLHNIIIIMYTSAAVAIKSELRVRLCI